MHLRVLLFLLAAPALALAGPDGQDQELGDFEDFDELYLGKLLDVVYTAARHEQEIGKSPSAVFVITREDIQASGATTITDVLRMVPGMDVVMSTPAFSSITTRLYWSEENNHFLVLIDGREANLEWFGTPLLDPQPIMLEDVERIEVIRGAGSSLYGANALAGVVYITTRSIPEKTAARLRLAGLETVSPGRGNLRGFGCRRQRRRSGRFFHPAENLAPGLRLRGFEGTPVLAPGAV